MCVYITHWDTFLNKSISKDRLGLEICHKMSPLSFSELVLSHIVLSCYDSAFCCVLKKLKRINKKKKWSPPVPLINRRINLSSRCRNPACQSVMRKMSSAATLVHAAKRPQQVRAKSITYILRIKCKSYPWRTIMAGLSISAAIRKQIIFARQEILIRPRRVGTPSGFVMRLRESLVQSPARNTSIKI